MACGVTEVIVFKKRSLFGSVYFLGGVVGLCELLGWGYSILRLRVFWAEVIPFCGCEPFELVDVDFGFTFAFVGFAFLRSECVCFESTIKTLDECKIDILRTVFGWVHAISMVWSPYEFAFTIAIWARI